MFNRRDETIINFELNQTMKHHHITTESIPHRPHLDRYLYRLEKKQRCYANNLWSLDLLRSGLLTRKARWCTDAQSVPECWVKCSSSTCECATQYSRRAFRRNANPERKLRMHYYSPVLDAWGTSIEPCIPTVVYQEDDTRPQTIRIPQHRKLLYH